VDIKLQVNDKEFIFNDPDASDITQADVTSVLKLDVIIMLKRWLAARAQALNVVLSSADAPEVFRLQGQLRELTMLYNLEEILRQFVKEQEDGSKARSNTTSRIARPTAAVN